MHKRVRATLAIGVAAAASLAPNAAAQSSAGELNESRGLRSAVTDAGITEHLKAFQTHSTLNGGNRVGGSPGYEASANYVTARLQAAGYTVRSHAFEFVFNADRTPPVLREQGGSEFVDGVDFASMTFSPNGDATAPVTAVDTVEPTGAGNVSTSGCESADFAGFPAGTIALVQRGTCSFGVKASNAAAAGAVGTIVYNEGQPGRTGIINGTLGGPQSYAGGVVGATYAVGQELANGIRNGPTGSTVRLKVDRVNENRRTRNLIAELPAGGLDGSADDAADEVADEVVVVGAHLDSVSRGAGINDNGSGSATILEIAEALAARTAEPRNTIQFNWYGAEEFGLLGSRAYVADLKRDQPKAFERVAGMLNFDMVASPNFGRFVYDGDKSAFPADNVPQGSGEIERVFVDYFRNVSLASGPTEFSGRSDYGPWIAEGVPAGGLFTGAEGVKTATQAQQYGGTAGVAYDRCYHLRCDDLTNINHTALDQMSDAAAHTAYTLGRRDFVRNPLVDPAAPVGSSDPGRGGGGLHPEHDHDEVAR